MEQEGFSTAEQRGGGPLASFLVVVGIAELRGKTEVADPLPTQKLQHRGCQTHAGLAQVVSPVKVINRRSV